MFQMPGEDGPREGAGRSKNTPGWQVLDFCCTTKCQQIFDKLQLVSSIPRTPKRSSMRFEKKDVGKFWVHGKLYCKSILIEFIVHSLQVFS